MQWKRLNTPSIIESTKSQHLIVGYAMSWKDSSDSSRCHSWDTSGRDISLESGSHGIRRKHLRLIERTIAKIGLTQSWRRWRMSASRFVFKITELRHHPVVKRYHSQWFSISRWILLRKHGSSLEVIGQILRHPWHIRPSLHVKACVLPLLSRHLKA